MSDYSTFPQYAKTSHPDVLAALAETQRRRDEFFAKMRALSVKYTGKPNRCYYRGWEHDSCWVSGISAEAVDQDKLPGQWKKPDGDVLAPYKNNPAAQDFKIGYRAAEVPGRGNLRMGHGVMGTGTLFEHDGAVYSRFDFDLMPEPGDDKAAEYGWEEIKASEFHAALEAEQERRAAEAKKES